VGGMMLNNSLFPYRRKVPKTRYYVMRNEILAPVDLICEYAELLLRGNFDLIPTLEAQKDMLYANIATIEYCATTIKHNLESQVFETEKDILTFWNANRQHVYDVVAAASQLSALKSQVTPSTFRKTEWLGSLIETAQQLAAVIEIIAKPDDNMPLS
jgi:hypothetical protein